MKHKTQLLYKGVVKDGMVKVPANQIRVDIPIYFSDGDRVDVIIRHSQKPRSNEQNRYYWGVVIPIIRRGLKDIGEFWSYEDVHLALKMKFLKVNYDFGLDLTPSTTKLSSDAMTQYLENIRAWAWDNLKVSIPEPGEQVELKFS